MQRKLISLLILCVLLLTALDNASYSFHSDTRIDDVEPNRIALETEGIPVSSNDFPVPMDISGNTYSDHARITITSNSEFLSQQSVESWSGTGVELDPIVITGYNFTHTTGVLISVSNTDLHFRIDGNFFQVPAENYYGISLSNVTNGNITNNYFDKADAGVRFDGVNFTSVEGNHFTSFTGTSIVSGRNNSISHNFFNTTDTSVWLYSTSVFNNTVYNNTLVGSTYGVYLYGSRQNTISLNNITQTSQYGIYLTQTTTALNLITDNIIQDSVGPGNTGIFVYSYAHNNTISLNNITNVTLSIRLSFADNNTVSLNQITNTTQAISVESSQWNEVYQNNISDVADGYLGAYALNIYKGGNNTLHHNNITDIDNGVFIYQSGQNVLHHNNLSSVSSFGINSMTGVLNTIYDNEISNGTTAIRLSTSSTNNTLSRNQLHFQNQGVQIQGTSHYNTFDENTIMNATNYGIDSTSSSYLTIYNNTIANSGLRGITIDPTSYHEIAFNNLINNGQYGIYLDTGLGSEIYNNSIQHHTSAGAYVISTNQYNISFNAFENSTVGLSLPISDSGYIVGNAFSNNTDSGLFLDGTDGCTITDNLFENNGNYGLRLTNSGGNTVENNTIRSTSQYGFVIESGSNTNFIRFNVIEHNSIYGIWLHSGPNTIRLNNISQNGVGIYVDSTTINSIESNFIGSNTDGIRLVDSDSNTLQLNTIYNNSQYGIYSESGFPEENNGNKIHNNTIIENGVYGVWLYATARTSEVKWNDFINNTDHARDSNPSSYLNVWDGNFYDDWDQAQSYYSIIGINIRDYNPTVLPINPSRIHFMLSPSITSPVAGNDYTGDITITWNPAYDSDGHAITYALYYSNNSGSNWYSIVSGLTNTSFYWNATSLSEGTEYQVRIAANDTLNVTSASETGVFSIDTKAPRLGDTPSNFTVELSFDPPPPVYFSAFDANPDLAYIEWSGAPITDFINWANDTVEEFIFYDGSVQFGVGVHPVYLVVFDIAGHETRYLFYMTVEDTTAPTISISETNQTFELGPHGSILSWTAYDLAQGTYEAYFSNSLDMTGSWFSNTGTELDVDGYMPGVYNVTIVFYDTSGNNVSHSINMTVVDTTAPNIAMFPTDDTIEFGTTGNVLNWTVVELDPNTYNVTINSTFIDEFVYSNGTVLLDIDGLALGFHNITTVFFDNSGNLTNDTVFITVFDTITPMISSQNDVVVEFGTVDNVVSFTATDFLPYNYTVFIDASFWTSGFWSNGSVVAIDVDGLSVGNHTLQIYFADTTNNNEYTEIVITVQDTTVPEWIQTPANIVIELGSQFYYDVNASDSSTLTYSIDDTTNFVIDALSGEISNATTLAVGVYDLQINATDNLGNVLTLTVSITVEDTTAPEINLSADDIQYTEGDTGNTATWIVTDLDSGNYSVYLDDELLTTGTWTTSVPIVIGIDGLSEGIYTLEIHFFDDSGNMISDSITVIVNTDVTTPSTTTTTTTTTDTPTGPSTPPADGLPLLLVIGGGAAGVVIIGLGIILLKKKGS